MNKTPYFFNPNLSSEELENWLAAQKAALANFNSLKREKTALKREIAALSKQLSEVKRKLESANDFFTSDKLSFPWDPSPLPKVDKL